MRPLSSRAEVTRRFSAGLQPAEVGEDSEEALPMMMIVSELYDRTFCRTLASVVFAIIYISIFIPLHGSLIGTIDQSVPGGGLWWIYG